YFASTHELKRWHPCFFVPAVCRSHTLCNHHACCDEAVPLKQRKSVSARLCICVIEHQDHRAFRKRTSCVSPLQPLRRQNPLVTHLRQNTNLCFKLTNWRC